MNLVYRAALPALLSILVAGSAGAQTVLVGRVVGVHDGDTITVLSADQVQHKIRLAGIDAPELGQPWGQNARRTLSGLVFGQQVEVLTSKRDRYQREVGKVLRAGKDINLAVLDAGMAWWYREYAKEQAPSDRAAYARAEADAAGDQRGFWADRDPVPPWEWRRAKRRESTEPR
ncbi:thermonuclease family protein [Niveibacterium sp. 24ML]|uniref:thermonuclease family protein n=1 Tax=Niveibacterium sp. 24ML TaxID=2985512 RepID=UPI00226FF723|nr:thermonuclease family protein [Niveibacterium sp. 24ML]MCX9158142.1 thermonuclease family protein [Niveibacterium sp. 24ML]